MTEEVFIRGEIVGELPSGQKKVHLFVGRTDGIRFFVDKDCVDGKRIVPVADVSRGGWISTADRLPNPFESVLMHTPEDSPLPVVHEGYLTCNEIWMSLYREAYTLSEVTHWMPMPEPPKEG